MDTISITDSLRTVMMLQDKAASRAGTRASGGMKMGERNALHPELRQERSSADLKLVWINPAMTT